MPIVRILIWGLLLPSPVAAFSSSSLVLDGTTLWVVNPDADSISKIDTTAPGRNTFAVCSAPRALALASPVLWIVCEEDDLVVGFHTGEEHLVASWPVKRAPRGIVMLPDLTTAILAHDGEGTVGFLDTGTGTIEEVPVGENPRALAITSDASRLFVASFLTRGDVGEIWELDVGSRTVTRTIELIEDPGPDTTSSGVGFPNLLGALQVTPDDKGLLYGGLKSNSRRGFLNGPGLTPQNRLRGLLGHVDLTSNLDLVASRIDTNDADSVSAIATTPDGAYVLVAHQGAGRVSIYDLAESMTQTPGDGLGIDPVARFDVGHAPQGIVLSSDGNTAYVFNFLSRDISFVDIRVIDAPVVIETRSVVEETLPPRVAHGKKLFHRSTEPVHSLENYIACASCHPDGGHDGRTWDFTQFGEGLRNTIDLRGRGGLDHGPVHWSANFDEIQDFENDIVHAFGGTGLAQDGAEPHWPLGGTPNAGRSQDLDDLAAYVSSLKTAPRSPHRNPDGTLTTSARNGRAVFYRDDVQCATCHVPPRFTDSGVRENGDFLVHDVGTMNEFLSGRRLDSPLRGIDTPTLLGAWASAPYLHRGQAASVVDVLAQAGDQHGNTSHLSNDELADLAAFVLSLDVASEDVLPTDPPPEERSKRSGCAAIPVETAWLFGMLLLARHLFRRKQ